MEGNRRENRCLLVIFDRKEIAHLGAFTIARFCGGAVLKIAAATAKNRGILVHSRPTDHMPRYVLLKTKGGFAERIGRNCLFTTGTLLLKTVLLRLFCLQSELVLLTFEDFLLTM